MRAATRSIDGLFAAAYGHYTRYIDPVTHQRGTIFNVVTWLVHQKEMTARLMNRAGASRMIGIGFRRWKQANLAPMLALNRSEEHTSELQSLMRISYAVFCLKKKKRNKILNTYYDMSTSI